MIMKNEILEAALNYHKMGLSIIPFEGKEPIAKWKKYQTEKADEAQIREWFDKENPPNVGFVTGVISDLVVVDVDTKEGKETIQNYISDSLITPTVRTPREGQHLYFHCPDSNLRGHTKRPPGCDLRANGNCVVAPPSVGSNGVKYTWEVGLDTPKAWLPEPYLSYIRNNTHNYINRGNNMDIPEQMFVEGRRDEDLFHVANYLFKSRMPEHEILQVIEKLALSCNPPFPLKEAFKKVESALKRSERRGGNRAGQFGVVELDASVQIEKKNLIDSLLKWNDILSLNVQTECLLQNLIPKGSITLLFGRGGIGKTSLAMQISRAIAEGLPFGNLQTIKTPVYYIDFENPVTFLKERIEKIGQADNLYVWHLSNNPMPPRLDGLQWELYKQLPAGLLIFDTLRASHLSDENNSQDMAVIISRLKELRERGFTILLLHHTPKGNEGVYKGSTALLDLVDHCLGLEGLKGDDIAEFDEDNIYKLSVRIKTRYEPHHIFLKFNPDIKGFEVAKDPDYGKLQDIYELLKDIQPAKQKELKEKIKGDLGYSECEIRRLLKKGEGIYWTVTTALDKKGKPKTYLCICVDTIYSRHKYINTPDTQKPFNTNSISNTVQSLDNTVLVDDSNVASTQMHKCQNSENEVIDLTGDDVEIIG